MPPDLDKNPVWPYWPQRLRTSSSHEEGASRDWSVATKRFEGRNGKVEKLVAARVEWKNGKMQEIPGTEFEMKADLVLLAMGFVSPVQSVLDAFGVQKDAAATPRRRPMEPAVMQPRSAKYSPPATCAEASTRRVGNTRRSPVRTGGG